MPSLRAYSAGSFLVYWLLLVLKLNPVQKFALRTEVNWAAINSCEPNHWHTDRQREWTNSYSIYCAMCVCCMKWRGWWKPILLWLLFDRTKRKMNDFIFIIKQIKARIWRWIDLEMAMVEVSISISLQILRSKIKKIWINTKMTFFPKKSGHFSIFRGIFTRNI